MKTKKEKKEPVVEVAKYTMKELEAAKEAIVATIDEKSKELQEMSFEVDIESKSFLNSLIKRIETSYKWKHSEIVGYVMLCNNLREQKNRKDLEKTILLRTANISTLYKTLVEFNGIGIHEAKDHLKTLTVMGESISNAMKSIEESNQKIRDLYTEFNDIETKITANKEGLKVSE